MSSRQHEGPHGSSRLDRLNSLKNIILPLIQFLEQLYAPIRFFILLNLWFWIILPLIQFLEKLYSPIRFIILLDLWFWVILALKYISAYMFFAGLEVNGFYIIRPSVTPYNDTAASATHNHWNLTPDLATCDLRGTRHSRCLQYNSYATLGLAERLSSHLKFPHKSFPSGEVKTENLSPLQKQGLQLLSTYDLSIHSQAKDFPLQCPFNAFNLIFFDGLINPDAVSLEWTDQTPNLVYLGQVSQAYRFFYR